MDYIFTDEEYRQIISHFGQEFFDILKSKLRACASEWKLGIIGMADYFSVNCIFICRLDSGEKAVLKICRQPLGQVLSEAYTLLEYNGRGNKFCKLLRLDAENGIILEEYISPGIPLKNEPSPDRRMEIFAGLFGGLHTDIGSELGKISLYPSYMQWVDSITEYMRGIPGRSAFLSYMEKARDVCAGIISLYPQKLLLHGDFHYDNILLGENGAYRIIDPKGVVGPAVFDLPRYILNEYCDSRDESDKGRRALINRIIGYFERRLGIPQKIIRQSFFVEMSMAACWDIEDGAEPDINDLIFAESIMDSRDGGA